MNTTPWREGERVDTQLRSRCGPARCTHIPADVLRAGYPHRTETGNSRPVECAFVRGVNPCRLCVGACDGGGCAAGDGGGLASGCRLVGDGSEADGVG